MLNSDLKPLALLIMVLVVAATVIAFLFAFGVL